MLGGVLGTTDESSLMRLLGRGRPALRQVLGWELLGQAALMPDASASGSLAIAGALVVATRDLVGWVDRV